MTVSIVKIDDPLQSLRNAVALCDGFAGLDKNARVVVKPNVSVGLPLPPYGMITTTSLLEGLIQLLIERGCSDITIAEGSIQVLGIETHRAYARTEIDKLAAKYGVRLLDLNRGPFRSVDLGGTQVSIARVALEADFLINLPVLKTHGLTKVSLGFKNLKGCLSPAFKTKFHGSGRLGELIFLLNEAVKCHLTIIDGTYTLETGPDTLLGTAHRKNLVIAGQNTFACDVVGSTIMGIVPGEVNHLRAYADHHGRRLSVDSIQLAGEKDISTLQDHLEWKPDVVKELLTPAGITGISVPHPGDSLCSRCYANIGLALVAFVNENPNCDCGNVVICCGKDVRPEHATQKAILHGDCAIKHYAGDNTKAVPVKGCPPSLWDTLMAFHVTLLGRRRSLRVIPKELLGLAGAKIGVYDYGLPKWIAYDSGGFDKADFQVSRRPRMYPTPRQCPH